jgi:deoxyribodipyrimidine photo-lyase
MFKPIMKENIIIFWFRRDLRLIDNAGLWNALKQGKKVLCVFIFDTDILKLLPSTYDRRVHYIHHAVTELQTELKTLDSSLRVYHSSPENAFNQILQQFNVEAVYANHDYEPYAIARDKSILQLLGKKNIIFNTYKDQCIFEKNEVLKDDGTPYTIFTPYSKKWKLKLNEFYLRSYPTEKYYNNFLKIRTEEIPTLLQLGFEKTDVITQVSFPSKELLQGYKNTRDIPSLPGTSRLSVHLRFGTVSVRKLIREALNISESWVNELIWRDFYMMILFHFPHVASSSFKKKYDSIVWRNNENEFKLWCEGKTGFPIVDAGMRELNSTGFMHNRVRMIVSSFLVKDLLIDWRWGETYFAAKLNDYDLSANNGGWQWAAGSGCDAAPYFRIFNPTEQQKKFDPEYRYIKKWVPEYGTASYPEPIVIHSEARLRALSAFKQALT